MKGYVEIFKAHDGKKGKWTAEEMDQAVRNSRFIPADLMILHKKANNSKIKVGEFSEIRRVGDSLFAKVREVKDGFRKLWGEKVFGGLSAGWRRDPAIGWYIDHVAAVDEPYIKNLSPAEFGEDEDEAATVILSAAIREFTGEEFAGFEKDNNPKGGDEKMTKDEILAAVKAAVEALGKELRIEVRKEFAEFGDGLAEKLAALGPAEKPAEKAAEKKPEESAEFAALVARNAQLERRLDEKECAEFCERLVREGRLTREEVTGKVVTLMHLDDGEATVEFAGAGGKKLKLTPRRHEMSVMERRPALRPEEREVSGGGRAEFSDDEAEYNHLKQQHPDEMKDVPLDTYRKDPGAFRKALKV